MIIVVAIIVAGLYYIASNTLRKNDNFNKHEVCFNKMFEVSGLPLIELNVLNEKKWFLVDSGANVNLIKDEYVKSMGDKIKALNNESSIFTGSESIRTDECYIELGYKKTKFGSHRFCIGDLNAFSQNRDVWGVDVIGILGGGFFEEQAWTICFDKMKLYIKK